MTAKHTPGPWHLYRDEDGDIVSVTAYGVGPNGGHVSWPLAQMPVPSKRLTREQINANGRMMRAAPELLETLQMFPGFTDDATVGDAWIEKMRAAITKATGGA